MYCLSHTCFFVNETGVKIHRNLFLYPVCIRPNPGKQGKKLSGI